MQKTASNAWNRIEELGFGFLYWFLFLLVLEPGNLSRAQESGITISIQGELTRIIGAAALGAAATPLILAAIRYFPVERNNLHRNLLIQAAICAAVSFCLIFVSCVLAAWLGVGDSRPVLVALPEHITSNWLLLTFSLAVLVLAAHTFRYFRQYEESSNLLTEFQASRATVESAAEKSYPGEIEVKSRGSSTFLKVADIDWIETQGNYQAIHVANASHLIRETSVQLESRLDPKRFIRVHRRSLVAIARIAAFTPLANGDAELKLANGVTVKVSRSFRDQVREALNERLQPAT